MERRCKKCMLDSVYTELAESASSEMRFCTPNASRGPPRQTYITSTTAWELSWAGSVSCSDPVGTPRRSSGTASSEGSTEPRPAQACTSLTAAARRVGRAGPRRPRLRLRRARVFSNLTPQAGRAYRRLEYHFPYRPAETPPTVAARHPMVAAARGRRCLMRPPPAETPCRKGTFQTRADDFAHIPLSTHVALALQLGVCASQFAVA